MKPVKAIPAADVIPADLRKFLKSYPYLVIVGVPTKDKGYLVDVNPPPTRIQMVTKATTVIPRGIKSSERFWLHVQKSNDANGCWPWTGKLSDRGVGQFCLMPQHPMSAPRVSWTLTHEKKPTKHEYVIRKPECTTSSCVRPTHLMTVNASEKQTMILTKAKESRLITPSKVRHIFLAGLRGEKLKDTSKRLGVSRYYASRVQLGKIRTDVTKALRMANGKRFHPIAPRSWKLNPTDLTQIARMLDKGVTGVKIASRFSVNPSVISRIRNGKRAGIHGTVLQAVAPN